MRENNSGAVLVIVLWVLAILTAISLGLSYRAGLEAKRVGAISGKVQSLALCQAALQRVIFELQADSQNYDALTDSWANNPSLFDRYRLQTGTYTVQSERSDPQDESKRQILFGACDEESKINASTATKEIWERLLKAQGVNPDLAEAILDWTDTDSNTRFHGAEAYDYASQDPPYAPRNGKLQLLDELLLVKGMTPEIFKGLAPHLTIYGEGKVNINTASREVMLAVGISPDLTEKILRYRQGLDEKEGTGDDGIFRDLGRAADTLASAESLSNADRFALNNLTGLLTVSSRFFNIHAQGQSTSGMATRVEVVVERFPTSQGLPAKVLSWRES